MSEQNHEPYQALGSRLKFLREQWQQTVQDVSGTLEIDESTLLAIESGMTLPAKELLDMLISHFLLTEDQAQDLHDLAESQLDQAGEALSSGIEDMLMKQVVMYLPVDNKVVYTDTMHATVNDHGVTLQFMQTPASGHQPVGVSRVGMSREHAEKVIEVLQNTLKQHDDSKRQKLLKSPEQDAK
jgi:DNA-binding XRE family transcriptional regulator